MSTGKREGVLFQNHVPEPVALAYPDGVEKEFQKENRSWRSVMYTLVDGRVMWLDPEVAQKIRVAQIQPQQTFWLCKRPVRGQKARWDLYLEDPTPRAQESPLERDMRLTISQAERGREAASQRPAAPPVSAQPNQMAACLNHVSDTSQDINPPAPRPAVVASVQPMQPSQRPQWADTLERQAEHLVDVYGAMVRYATEHHPGIVSREDCRALLTTCFINLSQKGRTNAA